ncbi:MAG: GDYXXLXY domain-containing protein [Burkholderiales bacterium]
MRKGLVLVTGLVILVLVNYSIYSRERLLTEGRLVLLQLAPVDPRSLMQGDYMALRFQVANDLRSHVKKESAHDSHVVVTIDDRRLGTFARLDDGSSLAANELRMRYRMRNEQIKFGTNAYFFQEGDAQLFSRARYGEFRVGSDGESILSGLRDEQFAALGRAAQ